jgi:hypothetical protein
VIGPRLAAAPIAVAATIALAASAKTIRFMVFLLRWTTALA